MDSRRLISGSGPDQFSRRLDLCGRNTGESCHAVRRLGTRGTSKHLAQVDRVGGPHLHLQHHRLGPQPDLDVLLQHLRQPDDTCHRFGDGQRQLLQPNWRQRVPASWWLLRNRIPVQTDIEELVRRFLETFNAAFFTTFASDVLKLFFNATTIATLARDATSPATSLYCSLHTASPGAGGDQTTNEISYTGYARVAVVRTSSGWTISTNTVVPAANITFGACTAGSGTVTHWAIGTGSSGAGYGMFFGTVTPNISVSSGVTPILTTASMGTLA